MKRKSRGQSLVEFALVFPVLVLLLFIAIDFGYYVFIWSEVQFSARRSAEQASRMQPRQMLTADAYWDVENDPCLRQIFREASRAGGFNGQTQIFPSDVYLSFHLTTNDATASLNAQAKTLGRIAQVRVHKEVTPLTPLTRWVLGGRDYKFNAVSRRTIVANGPSFPMVIDGADYNTCID
jgi:Flp pilus assembly protein TadG